ncbi:MAG: NUDIX hydrolase [Proteobacteria bacterium]|nr:NUDIX hydrolase [Pseudomonadota bacterium]
MNYKNPWKTVSTKTIYENPWLRLREDEVIRPDGKDGIYGVVEIKPSIGVVAINEKDEIAIVGQWRYTLKKYSWEIPTGGSVKEDNTILDAAKRELEEETGIQAAEWTALGSIDNSNGVTTDVAHLFLAKRLTYLTPKQEPNEQIVTKWISFKRAVQMVMNGDITESCSVAAILKVYKMRLSQL